MADPGIFKKDEGGFLKFIWNSEKKEILGRTGTSWGKIGFFYLIYYGCLAGFFAAMLAVLYTTIDKGVPSYTPEDKGSLLRNPALGFRPLPRADNVESTLIWYKSGDAKDVEHWAKQLDTFISKYKGRTPDTTNDHMCSFEEFMKDELQGITHEERVCKYQDDWLKGTCTEAAKWGYMENSPCVILKLNRMIGWKPEYYKTVTELPKEMPEYLRQHIIKDTNDWNKNGTVKPMVWVSCEGENPVDKSYIPRIDMYPFYGFPAYYFPYRKNDKYLSPIIGVQFSDPKIHVLINVECKAWAKNIEHVRGNRLGLVHFEILKD